MAGIQETKDVLDFMCSLGNAAGSVLEDGQVGLGDWLKVMEPLKKAGPAWKDAAMIPGELAELSAAEMAELVAYAQDKLSLPDSARPIEQKIELCLQAFQKLYDVVLMFRPIQA